MAADGWIRVADLAEIPPEGLYRFEVGSSVRVLARSGDDVYALAGICSHAHAELCEGEIEGGTLWCPLHSAGFDVKTGDVTSPPAEHPIDTYEVKLRDGAVFVARDPR